MKRLVTALIAVPIMLMLNQCIIAPYTTGYVDGLVWDAGDGYPLAGVYVEIVRQPVCGSCPHPHSYEATLVAKFFTDHDGYFACEFPWQEGYSYKLVLSAVDYYSASRPLGCGPDQYVEIALEPAW